MRRLTLLLIFVLLLVLTVPIHAQEDSVYWPTEGWQTSTPEAQGMSSAALLPLVNRLAVTPDPPHSLLIIRNGYVVLESSSFPFRADEIHWQFSVTKSVISTLIGIAIDQGYIEGVDQPIWDFFDAAATANTDERKAAITIENLLTHSSGLQMSSFEDMAMYALTADDQSWVQFVLDRPVSTDPGTRFNYLDANAQLLSAIIQQATGMTTLAYAQQNLFEPLGIREVSWRADPQGVYLGGDGLAMTPYDMAKLGYLYLNQGVWEGQQIVSSDWITAASSEHVSQSSFWEGYGYFWWTGTFDREAPVDSYAALGFGGQEIYVIPEDNLVVVTTGDFSFDLFQQIENTIHPAIVSSEPLPDDLEAQQELAAQIAIIEAHEPVAVEPLTETQRAVAGTEFALEANDLGWETMSIDFADNIAMLHVGFDDAEMEIPVGLDRVDRFSTVPLPENHTWLPRGPFWNPIPEMPVASRGAWMSDSRFSMVTWDTSGGQSWRIMIDFGDTVDIRITPALADTSSVRIIGTPQ